MKITLRTAGAGDMPDETDISDAFDIVFGEGEARIHASVVNDQLTLRCGDRIVLEPMAANSVAVRPARFSAPANVQSQPAPFTVGPVEIREHSSLWPRDRGLWQWRAPSRGILHWEGYFTTRGEAIAAGEAALRKLPPQDEEPRHG